MKTFKQFVDEGLRQAMSGPKETPSQRRKRQEKDNFDLYKKRATIAAARTNSYACPWFTGKTSSTINFLKLY